MGSNYSNTELEQDKVMWKRPVIDRIDIKKTLLGAGSGTDGFSTSFNTV